MRESLLWKLCYGVFVVEALFRGIAVVGIFGVESSLWNHCCEIYVVESGLQYPNCKICVVES